MPRHAVPTIYAGVIRFWHGGDALSNIDGHRKMAGGAKCIADTLSTMQV